MIFAFSILSYLYNLKQKMKAFNPHLTEPLQHALQWLQQWPKRWRAAWEGSLRFKLLTLGLMPLLIAFPIVIALLVLVGGERANSLLYRNVRSNLASSHNYLDQLKSEAGARVGQLVKSERLIHLLKNPENPRELDQLLVTAAEGSGLDFLLIARADGGVMASSTGVPKGTQLPATYVIRQAQIGVSNSAYERIHANELLAFSPQFQELAAVEVEPLNGGPPASQSSGLLINAAAHFPLDIQHPDAIIVGGILLNKNAPLIEHMREIIFPIGSLPDDAEGITTLFLDDARIAVSRQRHKGAPSLGRRIAPEVFQAVVGQGQTWLGRRRLDGITYVTGYEAITDGNGQRIGMIGVGFPYAPYLKGMLWMLGSVTALLALTMLGLSLLFLRAGRELTQQLDRISQTLTHVQLGDRRARVASGRRSDELGRLANHFNMLLDTIDAQDEQQRASQQRLADEASRRRALFEHERDGVAILNEDGSVFEVNPKCADMLGYSTRELLNRPAEEWMPERPAGQVTRALERVGPEGLFFETQLRRRDGSTFEAEISLSRARWGERTFFFVLQRDITQRKLIEAELTQYRANLERLVEQRTLELQEHAEQLATIFSLSPDGLVSFDHQQRVSFANPAFYRITGLQHQDVIGLNESQFSQLLSRRSLANAAFAGVAALRASHEADEPAGKRHVFELSAPASRVIEAGLRTSETVPVTQVLHFRDITHEQEVDRLKSEFLSTAAHELRTPMASIYGYIELMLHKEFPAEQRHEFMSTIARQAELMASIINELLDLARIEARRGKDFVLERLYVSDIVQEAVTSYKPPSGRPSPTLEIPARSGSVLVDRKKIHQVLINILSNAYKYSPAGGSVQLRLRHQQGADHTPWIGIEIQDHGIGMSNEQLHRVFERFYRADTSGTIPGTGLGMSIAKEIAELHGGRLELLSQEGQGTTVTLWLPAA